MKNRPTNLYRLQFNPAFTLYDAIGVLPYLKDLGIDTLYCSPVLQPTKGSTHGYDLINPLRFNEEIGGEKAFLAFCFLAKSLGLSIILDIVVNHMSASLENPWWYDLLENGPDSEYADYFDVDFQPQLPFLRNKVLVPILDRPFHQALEQDLILLVLQEQRLALRVMGLLFPISAEGYIECLKAIEVFSRDQNIQETWKLLIKKEGGKQAVEKLIAEINQDKSRLETFVGKQHFLLEFWQYANQNSNYRRFFDIHSLAAIKMENAQVFDHFHHLIGKLLKDKLIQGLRIDHPDGLYEPYHYLDHLQKLYQTLVPLEKKPLYLVVEKILQKGERLPSHWPVQGTVGYEYLNLLQQMFVDQKQEENFSELYDAFLEDKVDKDLLLQKEKREFALLYMTSEMKALACKFFQCAVASKMEDISVEHLEEALIELYVFFPVYRTYLDHEMGALSSEQKTLLLEVFDKAKKNKPFLENSFAYLRSLFLDRCSVLTPLETACIMKFQQLSPVIMAKGLEDTHLYNYNRFIALNEVGGEPHGFGESIEVFHSEMEFKLKHHPDGWIALSTHDTKRSFDMRMRLCVLSEMFSEWKELVLSWKKQNACYKIHVEKELFPDSNREYFLYQTLVGFWPKDILDKSALLQRLKSYLIKASRESKAYTTWIHHHLVYEKALDHFLESILDEKTPFYKSLSKFVHKIDRVGQLNSLSCINLTLGLPAPLDIYQGTENWDFSLVDPDNRRPIDYKQRKTSLLKLKSITCYKKWFEDALQQEDLQPLKMYLLYRGLYARRESEELFLKATYIPVKCEGEKHHHIIAYIRQEGGFCTLVISGRFLLGYQDSSFWKDTYIFIPQDLVGITLTNIYTQASLQFKEIMSLKTLLEELPFGFWMS